MISPWGKYRMLIFKLAKLRHQVEMVFIQDLSKKWKILRGNLTQAVAHFFAKRILPKAVKDTYVILIPKIHNQFELKDYRPIGLCNVINKVVAKFLVNRLWPILDDIILENHSLFSLGRMITDNALLAFECMHYMEHVYFS
jgi:hypothetical protein